MKPIVKYLITIVAFAGIMVTAWFLMRGVDTERDNQSREAAKIEEQRIEATIHRDSVCEVLVEMGRVIYGATAEKSFRLKNATDEPIALLDYTTTCKCTWLELPNEPIKAGGEADVKMLFDSRGEFGNIGNFLTILTSDERCKVLVWMGAEVE